MTSSKRDDILHTAWRLFESQGYHATGINQIITESGVPKGSFYHYFPEGKEGLAIEAIDAIGNAIGAKFAEVCRAGPDPITAISGLIRDVARHLAESGYQHGGPLTTVALETATTNERINQACQEAYNNLRRELSHQLCEADFSEKDARELSTMIVAGLEGGVILSRTFHSTEPLDQFADQVAHLMTQRLNREPVTHDDRHE